MQWAVVLNLALRDDAHSLKAIFEAIHTVPEPPIKTIKILGQAIEFFVAFQRTRLELEHCLRIARVWCANLLTVTIAPTVANGSGSS